MGKYELRITSYEFIVEFVDVGVLSAEDLAVCGAVCAVFEEVFFVFCG